MAVSHESAGLGSALTDLMTSLAVIFILLLVASHNKKQQHLQVSQAQLNSTRAQFETAQQALQQAQQQTHTTRSNMLVALQQALDIFAVQGVRAEADPRDPLSLLVLVPEGLLEFAVNRDAIPPGGLTFLRNFAPKMAETLCAEPFRDDISTMVIEGHTDSSGSDAINLPLSQARSMAVAQASLAVVGQDTTLRSCFLGLLSASGRGSSEPWLDPAGREDRARSRRVVFKIRVRSLEQRQMYNLLSSGHAVAAPRTPDAQL